MTAPASCWFDRLRRFGAGVAAAVLFALAICAASPDAHRWVHASDAAAPHGEGDVDGCAVVLFAAGFDVPLAAIEVPRGLETPAGDWPVPARQVPAVAPYLCVPGRDPPAG